MYGIIQKFLLLASAHIIVLIAFINEHHKMLETISEVHIVTMRPVSFSYTSSKSCSILNGHLPHCKNIEKSAPIKE